MIGKELNGRYLIEQIIGTGGMADVYRAHDNLLGRTVAVKILHQQFAKDPVYIQRFRQEAQAAANLSQQNIVNVFDWGIEGQVYYIVMEYVQGSNLKEIIQHGGTLLPERAVEIAIAICAALNDAHDHGIVHRDIKPQNIIVTTDNQIKVMDFGIARSAEGSAMTQTGTIMGTAQYISPEQAQGRSADPRSDLYSLGVVIYEMLTGRVPFEGESPVAIAYKHVREDPFPPSMLNPDISPELESVVMKSLAKNPENRYQSDPEMRADLERCLEGTPVHATPILPPEEAAVAATRAYPVARRSRRSYKWVWILIIILLLAAGGVGSWALLRGSGGLAVPDLVGKTLSEAQTIVKEHGLRLTITKEASDSSKKEDEIISQDPKAGSKINKGGTVGVVVNKLGTEIVPDCTNLTQNEAAEAIKKAKLTLGKVSQSHSNTESGKVASQAPPPGTKVPAGTRVDLVISTGPEMIIVPNVVGMTKEDASQRLKNDGFGVRITETPDESKPEGYVISQDPQAGQRIPKGTEVTISVATQPETVPVPDVLGLLQNEAESQLVEAGFKVTIIEKQVSDPDEVGYVVGQNPSSGSDAEEGSRVTIYVGIPSSS